MNCNIAGVESYLDRLEFPGKEDFYGAARKSWKVDGQLAGYARQVMTSSDATQNIPDILCSGET